MNYSKVDLVKEKPRVVDFLIQNKIESSNEYEILGNSENYFYYVKGGIRDKEEKLIEEISVPSQEEIQTFYAEQLSKDKNNG